MNTFSRWCMAGIVGPLVLLAIAYFYFQLHLELIPCPLCMFQRAALVGVIVCCIVGLLHRPKNHLGQQVYRSLILLFSLIGAGIAGRQVWLQHLPADQVPACGIDPIYQWTESIGENFGIFDMIGTVLKGSGDCAEVDWALAGLSMGGWMLAIFSIMSMLTLFQLIKR